LPDNAGTATSEIGISNAEPFGPAVPYPGSSGAFEDGKTRLNSKKQLVNIPTPARCGPKANGQTAKPTNPAGAVAPAD
jgi:hypothetical protein